MGQQHGLDTIVDGVGLDANPQTWFIERCNRALASSCSLRHCPPTGGFLSPQFFRAEPSASSIIAIAVSILAQSKGGVAGRGTLDIRK
jgi:hypothetical protein